VLNAVHSNNPRLIDTQISKTKKMNLKDSSSYKNAFKQGPQLNRDKSFSSFVVRIVKKEAEAIVAQNDRIIASEKDRQDFFNAVFADSKPNQNLEAATKRYKSKQP